MFLVRLHCGPVVDFTTLHPFDFDRNLFIFLLAVLSHKTAYFGIQWIKINGTQLIKLTAQGLIDSNLTRNYVSCIKLLFIVHTL